MKCAVIDYEAIEKEFAKGCGIDEKKHFPEFNFATNVLCGIREYIDDHIICMIDIEEPARKTFFDYWKEKNA